MPALVDLDTVARLLGVGQLLLLAVVGVRSTADRQMRLVAALLFCAIAAYLINASPVLVTARSPHRYLTQLLAQSVPLLLWLFAHRLFERPVKRMVAGIGAAITLVTFAALVLGGPAGLIGNLVQHGLALALVAHALWLAWDGRDDDLVEARRRFRLGFVVAVGLQALGILIVELAVGFQPVGPGLMLLQSATSLLLILALGAGLLVADPDLLAPKAVPQAARAGLSPADAVLKDRLEAAIAAGIWARPGLTVGRLAAELSVPEHRLRQLINQRLGHRNFATWLNGHRVEAARQRLADPDLVNLPVLTIAMDLGYGSIAPFNRAFREATGTTPTDFRRQALAGD